MSSCGSCGAPLGGGPQCASCGALVDGEVALEVELPQPVPRPAPVPRPQPLAAPGPSFAEREAVGRRNYLRFTRVPILVLLGWFTASHLFFGASWVFVDHVNLALHEGGHLFFRLFGDTMHFLGGTLAQLLFPAAFTAYFFLRQRDRFAAAATAWWLGENGMGIARYMADAPDRALPLVGGNVHDWWYLFSKWGVLDSAGSIASAVRWIGAVIMLGALGAMVWWTVRPREADLDQ